MPSLAFSKKIQSRARNIGSVGCMVKVFCSESRNKSQNGRNRSPKCCSIIETMAEDSQLGPVFPRNHQASGVSIGIMAVQSVATLSKFFSGINLNIEKLQRSFDLSNQEMARSLRGIASGLPESDG